MRCRWLLALAMLGGCWADPDKFNRREAELLCELSSKCGDDWDFGVGQTPVASCEDDREEELAECTMACEYDEYAARDCVRALKKALRPSLLGPDCGLDENDAVAACSAVYLDCRPLPDEMLACDVPEPTFSCAVGTHAPAWGAIVWLGLAWTIRRPRAPRVGRPSAQSPVRSKHVT